MTVSCNATCGVPGVEIFSRSCLGVCGPPCLGPNVSTQPCTHPGIFVEMAIYSAYLNHLSLPFFFWNSLYKLMETVKRDNDDYKIM